MLALNRMWCRVPFSKFVFCDSMLFPHFLHRFLVELSDDGTDEVLSAAIVAIPDERGV